MRPLLFNILNDDISGVLDISYFLFADLKIHSVIIFIVGSLNSYLDPLDSPGKAKLYPTRGIVLDKLDVVCDLGVFFDTRLSFNYHVKQTVDSYLQDTRFCHS